MNLKEIFEFQKQFDLKHGWHWEGRDEKETLERLKYVAIAIAGESGEFANIVKKALRENFPDGKLPDKERMAKLKDELADIFIYTILASMVLKMDLEEEYFKKMKYNEQKYKDLKKQ